MVPHRQALRLITLIGLSSSDCAQKIADLSAKLDVKFPCEKTEFAESDFFPSLTPEVEACFTTSDILLTLDYRPFYAAARELGVERFIAIDENGPALGLSPSLLRWRSNATMRQFIECCILAGIPLTQISMDLSRMYGCDVNDADLKTFELLFVDRTYASGNSWLDYTRCIGDGEATFKRRLMNEPHDFVRWKLGVPVALASDLVIDRMISDAYYTERLLRHEAEDTTKLSKDELNRIKMERDTIFKCLDRRIKLKETDPKHTGNGSSVDAASAIRRIVLDFARQDFPLKGDLIGQDAPTLADLEKQNGSGPGPA